MMMVSLHMAFDDTPNVKGCSVTVSSRSSSTVGGSEKVTVTASDATGEPPVLTRAASGMVPLLTYLESLPHLTVVEPYGSVPLARTTACLPLTPSLTQRCVRVMGSPVAGSISVVVVVYVSPVMIDHSFCSASLSNVQDAERSDPVERAVSVRSVTDVGEVTGVPFSGAQYLLYVRLTSPSSSRYVLALT